MEYDDIDASFEDYRCEHDFCLGHINNEGVVGCGYYKNIDIVFDGGFSERAVYCWCYTQPDSIRGEIVSVRYLKGSLYVVFNNRNAISRGYEQFELEELVNRLVFNNNNCLGEHQNIKFKLSFLFSDGFYNIDEQGEWCGDLWNIYTRFGESKYHEYLKSNTWKTNSRLFKEKNNGFCSLCNTWVGIENLETHHKQYPKNFKDDSEVNWIAICKVCHKKLHGVNE